MSAGSDVVFQSDRRQSVSQADVDNVIAANARAREEFNPVSRQHGAEREVPEAGVSCPRDAKHGRMLMSLKSGMLECGPCGYSVAAPK